jgi:dienelactone hydrolase
MVTAPIVALALTLVTPVTPGPILTDVPAKPDPSARYVLYLHGRILEEQGRQAVSADFGPYEYDAILQAMANHRLTVISEVRKKGAGQEFVDHVVGQVKRLRAAGVPARSIAVVGASKGGGMTIQVAAALAEPAMSFVVLAGCGGNVALAPALRGRVLSIYDRSDRFKPSCRATFDAAPGLSAHEELVLELGKDHGLLYRPYPEWVLPTVNWIHAGARGR